MNYYLSSNSQVTGPYAKEEILDALKYGVISSDAQIRPDESESWLPIAILTTGEGSRAIESSVEPSIPFSEMLQTRAAADPAQVYPQYYQTKSSETAILLELLPGLFLQTFGIGNIYAGNVALGITLMLSYWALSVINFFLLFIIIGFITWPLTFCLYLIVAIIFAQKGADRTNRQQIMSGDGFNR